MFISLQTLLEAGANVHVEDSLDITPLHRAAESNWIAAAKILLKAGSNLVVYAYNGGAPIHWAAASGSVEVLEVCINALLCLTKHTFVVIARSWNTDRG